METKQPNGYIEQLPTPPNAWLTKLETQDEHDRMFAKKISYKEGMGHNWDECTQDYYDWWQETYNPQLEPSEPENN